MAGRGLRPTRQGLRAEGNQRPNVRKRCARPESYQQSEASIDIFPIADSDDQDHQPVVLDKVDDPIVSDADPV